MNPVFLPYGALLNAAFSPVATPARHLLDRDAAQHPFRVLRALRHQAGVQEHVHSRLPLGDRRHGDRRRDLLHHGAPGDHRLARARVPRDRAGRGARHRARRRPVPQLHAPAVRALRHAVDPADRVRHHRAARRLPAAAVGVPRRESRSRGGEPHPRRDAPAGARPHHGAAAAHQRDRHLVLHLRRRDPRAVRRHHPVHVGDESHFGADLRPQRSPATSAPSRCSASSCWSSRSRW